MNTVKNVVQNYTAVFKKSKLIVTGHSLGAALSTHAVAHLIHLGIKVDLFYNLGSPRVGDAKFHEWFTRVYGKFVGRIVHWKDPVPHLPFEAWGFQHLHNEVQIRLFRYSTPKAVRHTRCAATRAKTKLVVTSSTLTRASPTTSRTSISTTPPRCCSASDLYYYYY